MTLEEYIRQNLYQKGLWPEDVDKVMLHVRFHPDMKPMLHRWKEDVDDTSPEVITSLTFSVKRIALEWIEETCPQAWYKSMFI